MNRRNSSTQRELNFDDNASFGPGQQLQFVMDPIKGLEALTQVWKPDSCFELSFLLAQPKTVIFHANHQPLAQSLYDNADYARPRRWFDAMTERVFDQWLQEQGWHQAVERSRFDVLLEAETVAQSRLLDLNVALNEAQVFNERNFLLLGLA